MADKNLPHIQIYIGDWERDCNILSLEAEMAWMKIIFKMHLAGKQHEYKISAKGLQRLWKVDANGVQGIIEELLFEEICGIREIPGGYIFLSRRLEKENEISEIRSKAAKDRWDKEKANAKAKQNKSKKIQNSDNDNDNDNEIDNEVENENDEKGKTKKFTKRDFRKILLEHGAEENHVEDWLKVRALKKSANTETALTKFLNECSNHDFPVADAVEICAEKSWSGFKYKWLENSNHPITQKNGKAKASFATNR